MKIEINIDTIYDYLSDEEQEKLNMLAEMVLKNRGVEGNDVVGYTMRQRDELIKEVMPSNLEIKELVSKIIYKLLINNLLE